MAEVFETVLHHVTTIWINRFNNFRSIERSDRCKCIREQNWNEI